MVAATTVSPAELEFGIVVAVVASILVYRSSERFRLLYGVPPWRLPSWLWTALTFFFTPAALLFLVARYTTTPRTPPQRPPGGYPGYPGAGGYPGYPGAGGYPGHPGAGGYPRAGGYPGASGYPGHPGTGNYPRYPGDGGHPGAGGGEPSQSPGPPPLATPESWAPPGAPPVPTPGWQPPPPAADPSGLPLPPIVAEGWYVDPTERFFLRYWDGTRWTDQVASGGQQHRDPVRPGDGDAIQR